MPHSLENWTDRDTVLRILSATLPAAQAVAMYWMNDKSKPIAHNDWTAEPVFPPPETKNYHRYSGPGPLFVDINPYAVRVRTGGRWRGFMSIYPLRIVHVEAFQAIATAFNAPTMRCFPDDDHVNDAFWDGGDFETCCVILNNRYGAAVLMDNAALDVVTKVDTENPLLQYVFTFH